MTCSEIISTKQQQNTMKKTKVSVEIDAGISEIEVTTKIADFGALVSEQLTKISSGGPWVW